MYRMLISLLTEYANKEEYIMNGRMRDYMMRDNRMNDPAYDRNEYDRRYDREGMDGRNPYGSRGGYVTSSRPRGDRAYEYEGTFRGGDRAMYAERYYDSRMYPPMMGGRMDGNMDYSSGRLSPQELAEWYKKLMNEVSDSSKEMLSEEKILHKAKENNVKMDKFNEDEFVVTVLLMYTDYWESAGRGNIDMFVKLAEDFLCDKDSALQGGEKLAAYHDYVVM